MDQEKEKEIKEEVRRRLKDIEQHRDEAEKNNLEFACLSEVELVRKLQRTKSPYIYAQGWSSNGTPGQTRSYTVYIANPSGDPYQGALYVSVFFGVANFLDIGDGLSGRYQEWPVQTSQTVSLAPGANRYLRFDYQIPNDIPTGTNYMGNSVLWKCNWHDVGEYCDRGAFDINVE